MSRTILCIACACAAVSARAEDLLDLVPPAKKPPEPEHAGKPLSHWLSGLTADDRGVRRRSVHALIAIGRDAVPALERLLRDGRAEERAEAAGVMGYIGDWSVVAPLMAALKDPDLNVRTTATAALNRPSPSDRPDIVRIIFELSSPESGKRMTAAHKIGDCGPAAGKAAPRLIEILRWDTDDDARAAAAAALGKIWAEPKDAQTALLEGLKHRNRRVRVASAEAMGEIGCSDAAAIAALVEALGDSDQWVRAEAAAALGKAGPAAKPAVGALTQVLRDDAGDPVANAATALGRIGPAAVEAVPDLLRIMADAKGPARYEAGTAILKISRPAAEEAVPRIVERLKDPANCEVRAAAARMLGTLGSAAKSAVPALIEALADDDWYTRFRAAEALGEIGELSALPALKRATQDREGSVALAAAAAARRLERK